MIVSRFYLQPEYNGGSLQPPQVQGAGTLGKVGPSPGQDSAHGRTYRVAPRGPCLPPALSAFQVRVSGERGGCGGGLLLLQAPISWEILTHQKRIYKDTQHLSTKRLISSPSKTEMENFIPAYLRIINQETVFQKALRTVLPARGQSTVT